METEDVRDGEDTELKDALIEIDTAGVKLELNVAVGARELVVVLLAAPDDDAESDGEPATLNDGVSDSTEVLVGVCVIVAAVEGRTDEVGVRDTDGSTDADWLLLTLNVATALTVTEGLRLLLLAVVAEGVVAADVV